MNKLILAGLLCGSLISCPETGLAQSGSSRAVTSFTWIYKSQPQPGKRMWSRQPDGTWHERYPEGNVAKVFNTTRRGSVDGCAGAVVSGRQDQGLEIFIPDVGCRRMVAKFRRGAGHWADMGAMKSIGTAAVVARPDPPSKSSVPSIVKQPAVLVGVVPSEWVGKWLLLRGEFCSWIGKADDDNPACGNWDWILALESNSVQLITRDIPWAESSTRINSQRCNLDGKASSQESSSQEPPLFDVVFQYACKLEGRTISLNATSILKREEFVLPGVSIKKSDYGLRVRLMEDGRCQYVALDKKDHTAVSFKGNIEHRSHNFNSGGSLKRNISCKVFGSERAARKAYKGRAELKLKHEPQSSGNPDEELGD